MKFIKGFKEFLNEGASLVPPNYDTVNLSWTNDKTLPTEVLKTNGTVDVAGFRKIGLTKDGSFQLHYGLTVDPRRNATLGVEDPMFKKTLDALKGSAIRDRDKALYDFTSPTAKRILANKVKIDYVVSLGSTGGLSTDLGKTLNLHFKGSKFIPLPKYDFDTFQHALDWDYIRDYEIKVERDKKIPIFNRLKRDVLRAINQDLTAPELVLAISDAKNANELKGILLRANPKNRYHQYDPAGNTTIVWNDRPFHIRSSGISYGGSRHMYKTKYDTPKPSGEVGSTEFVEAVKDCILNEKTMIVVDDNARTKEDISKIFDMVITFAENLVKDKGYTTRTIDNYHKRFLAYVLIYIPVPLSQGDKRDITVEKLASQDQVNDFNAGGLANISRWIQDNRV